MIDIAGWKEWHRKVCDVLKLDVVERSVTLESIATLERENTELRQAVRDLRRLALPIVDNPEAPMSIWDYVLPLSKMIVATAHLVEDKE